MGGDTLMHMPEYYDDKDEDMRRLGYNVEDYFFTALAGFDNDPPDSDYQKGYLAALKEMRYCVYEQEEE